MIPDTCFAIDAHAHVGLSCEFPIVQPDIDDVVRLMDESHIRITVFSHFAWLNAQFEVGFTETVEVLEAHPERFRAYAVFDPHWPSESFHWIERFQDHPGFIGIKVHPAAHGVAPTDPRYADLWHLADERAWPVLTHSWSPEGIRANKRQDLAVPDLFAPVLEKHRNLKLLLGHAGGRPVGHQQAVELAQRFPNCFMDFSGDTTTLGIVEWLVEHAGVDRVLCGTDQIWIEPRIFLGRVLRSQLTVEEQWAVCVGNAQRLFGIEPLPG